MNQKQILIILENKGTHRTNVCFMLGENVLNKVEK